MASDGLMRRHYVGSRDGGLEREDPLGAIIKVGPGPLTLKVRPACADLSSGGSHAVDRRAPIEEVVCYSRSEAPGSS